MQATTHRFRKTVVTLTCAAALVCWKPQVERMAHAGDAPAAPARQGAQGSGTVEGQVKELIKQFDNRDKHEATFAEMSICNLGLAAIPALLAASGTATKSQLSHIGRVIGIMNFMYGATVPALMDELNDPNPAARRAAIFMLGGLRVNKALGKTGEAPVASALVGMLNDEDEGPRGAAFRILPGFGAAVGPLIGALGDRDGHAHALASSILIRMGAPIAPQLVSAMEDHRTDTESLMNVLGEMGKPAVPALLAGLKNPDLVVQIGCAGALGTIGDERALNPLIGALRSGKLPLRRVSAEALGNLGSKRALPALMEAAARHDEEDSVKEAANDAIREIRPGRTR
jgi:HEAT repeat protein